MVCRMLGYGAAYAALVKGDTGPPFGAGEGTIMLDNVACTGTEESIADCYHRGYQTSDCSHTEDAGVICIEGKIILTGPLTFGVFQVPLRR